MQPHLSPDARMNPHPFGWVNKNVPEQHDPEPLVTILAMCMAPILVAALGAVILVSVAAWVIRL